MKILLIDSGRGNRRAAIELWRSKLGTERTDDIALFSWQPPAEPLPVVDHLVFGPRLRTAREPQRSQTASGLFDDADIDLADMRRAARDAGPQVSRPGEPTLPSDQLASQLTEHDASAAGHDSPASEGASASSPEAAGSAEDADPTAFTYVLDGEDFTGDEEFDEALEARRARNRTALLPVYHPARVRQAAAWRANRVRLTARGAVRRVKREIGQGDSKPKQMIRKGIGETVANQYALAVARSQEAERIAAGVDVIVPMDYRSQRAAWVLAQRVPGPAVVLGFPAASRVIAQRRAVS